jgi:putative flippase GtrA
MAKATKTNRRFSQRLYDRVPIPAAARRRLDRIPGKRKELKRFIKFLIVGSVGFVVDAGTFNLLFLGLGFTGETERGIAKGISFGLAVISNFTINRHWTYRDSRSKAMHRQLLQFIIVSVVGLGINQVVFRALDGLLIAALTPALGERGGLAVGANLALICATVVVLFWNFFANRFWTYNDV